MCVNFAMPSFALLAVHSAHFVMIQQSMLPGFGARAFVPESTPVLRHADYLMQKHCHVLQQEADQPAHSF